MAGFQFSAEIIGRQTWPFSSIFGWYIFVLKQILGGLKGYSGGKLISIRKAPLLYGALSYRQKKKKIIKNQSIVTHKIIL